MHWWTMPRSLGRDASQDQGDGMTTKLNKLIEIASSSIGGAVSAEKLVAAFGDAKHSELLSMLKIKNGFYAFEGALHVFSDVGARNEKGLIAWNDSSLWIHEYRGMADGA